MHIAGKLAYWEKKGRRVASRIFLQPICELPHPTQPSVAGQSPVSCSNYWFRHTVSQAQPLTMNEATSTKKALVNLRMTDR